MRGAGEKEREDHFCVSVSHQCPQCRGTQLFSDMLCTLNPNSAWTFFGHAISHIRFSPWGLRVSKQNNGKDGENKERWEGMGGERTVGSVEKEVWEMEGRVEGKVQG